MFQNPLTRCFSSIPAWWAMKTLGTKFGRFSIPSALERAEKTDTTTGWCFPSVIKRPEESEWMDLVLDQFNAIASNVDHLHRLQAEVRRFDFSMAMFEMTYHDLPKLSDVSNGFVKNESSPLSKAAVDWQEECDVLSIVLTKYLRKIDYCEFKVVLLLVAQKVSKCCYSNVVSLQSSNFMQFQVGHSEILRQGVVMSMVPSTILQWASPGIWDTVCKGGT